MTITAPDMTGALCVTADVAFLEITGHDEVTAALKVCEACPVRAACEEFTASTTSRGRSGFAGVAGGKFWRLGRIAAPPKPTKVRRTFVVEDEQLRRLHAAFQRGERDPVTCEGERRYHAAGHEARRNRHFRTAQPTTRPTTSETR